MKMKECPTCDGEKTQPCDECDGSGTCKHCGDGQCPDCYGDGTQDCYECDGEGQVEDDTAEEESEE